VHFMHFLKTGEMCEESLKCIGVSIYPIKSVKARIICMPKKLLGQPLRVRVRSAWAKAWASLSVGSQFARKLLLSAVQMQFLSDARLY